MWVAWLLWYSPLCTTGITSVAFCLAFYFKLSIQMGCQVLYCAYWCYNIHSKPRVSNVYMQCVQIYCIKTRGMWSVLMSPREQNKKGTRTNYQQAYCWFGFERSHSQYVLMVKVRMLFSTMFGGTWLDTVNAKDLFSVQDGSYFWNRPLLNPRGVWGNSWMLTWSVHYRTLIAWRTQCECMRACVDMCYFATIFQRIETKFIGFYTVW